MSYEHVLARVDEINRSMRLMADVTQATRRIGAGSEQFASVLKAADARASEQLSPAGQSPLMSTAPAPMQQAMPGGYAAPGMYPMQGYAPQGYPMQGAPVGAMPGYGYGMPMQGVGWTPPAAQAPSTTTHLTPEMSAMFDQAAARYNVPPALAKAVGRAESGFRSDAQSGAGAQGIMQLMPGTARGLGVTNSFDPAQNIDGGVKYLGNMLRRFNGNASLALAGYNAGPNAVAKFGGIPPYAETQAYVRRVLSYAQDFGGLSSPPPAIPFTGSISPSSTIQPSWQ